MFKPKKILNIKVDKPKKQKKIKETIIVKDEIHLNELQASEFQKQLIFNYFPNILKDIRKIIENSTIIGCNLTNTKCTIITSENYIDINIDKKTEYVIMTKEKQIILRIEI